MVVITGDRILRVKDVMGKTSFGRTKIYSLLAQGRFPPAAQARQGDHLAGIPDRRLDR